VHLDPVTASRRSYRLEAVSLVHSALGDGTGRIWMAGTGGLERLEPGDGRFRLVPHFRNIELGGIRLDGRGRLVVPAERWLARVGDGGRVIERWTEPREAFGEAPIPPRILAVDREGGYWLGTIASGLLRLDPTPGVFQHAASASRRPIAVESDFVMALREAADGALWVGTLGGGAYRLAADRQTVLHTLKHTVDEPAALPSDNVWDFEEDRAGHLWIATSGGLCRVGEAGVECRSDQAVDIARTPDGWFWYARGESGAASFDPATGRHGDEIRGPAWIVAMFADAASGDLWIAGSELLRARVADGRLLEPPRRVPAAASIQEPIYQVHRDARGTLWLASGAGLQRWDAAAGVFAPVDLPELRNVRVFSMAEDAQGRLWLGTSHGLVRHSPVTGSTHRYRQRDGVASGEFNRRAAVLLRDGEMVFGGTHGLTRFRPERVGGPRDPPPLVFTRWRKVTANGVVEQVLVPPGGTRLLPGDRAFTLEFAALSFAAGPAHRYRYRLEGLDPDWIEASEHSVTYAAPPPGRYVFRVQTALGSEGEWSEPGAAMPLQVIPPFWRTAWFRALLAGVLLAMLWGLHRARLSRVVATERLRFRISRDLHDELGAGLSSIALLSDAVGASATITNRERTHIERIGRSARAMVADLRDIVWAIDPDGDRLQDVVGRMKDVAADLLSDVQVHFHAPPPAELSERVGMAARRDLLRIYKEVLNNIARHARAANVEIRLVSRADRLELLVSDDGAGFDPAGVRTGTGLKSMRERAAHIGARLELVSRNGGGTSVRVTLQRT
jgi:signal transduction histidine kinase